MILTILSPISRSRSHFGSSHESRAKSIKRGTFLLQSLMLVNHATVFGVVPVSTSLDQKTTTARQIFAFSQESGTAAFNVETSTSINCLRGHLRKLSAFRQTISGDVCRPGFAH